MAIRRFTPASARRTLAQVGPAAEQLCRIYRGLEQHPAEIGSDQRGDPGYLTLVRGLHATLADLGRAGVLIRDPRRGLVDFPARRAGREVVLCWRVGEPGLTHWQELHDGFGGRRPVDEDGPWEVDEGAPDHAAGPAVA